MDINVLYNAAGTPYFPVGTSVHIDAGRIISAVAMVMAREDMVAKQLRPTRKGVIKFIRKQIHDHGRTSIPGGVGHLELGVLGEERERLLIFADYEARRLFPRVFPAKPVGPAPVAPAPLPAGGGGTITIPGSSAVNEISTDNITTPLVNPTVE